MFVRKKQNKSGSISVQILKKEGKKNQLVQTIGSSKDATKIEYLCQKGYAAISEINGQMELELLSQSEKEVLQFFYKNDTIRIRVIGPEIIVGRIYDQIGFSQIGEELFRNLVITRIVYPGSKLRTIDYLQRYNGIELSSDKLYRYLDKINKYYKPLAEDIAYNHTREILGGEVKIVFYDITTLYFEAASEDDFRKMGFSKDGKAQNPQILLGLLVGLNGYPIGYDIFQGNTFEGKTFIPVIERYCKRFNTKCPVIVADAGLLSQENITQLKERRYNYIIGARLKNESEETKQSILKVKPTEGNFAEIKKEDGSRLIISYSNKRAAKDAHNRERGLRRLEKSLRTNRLTKKHINNRGYNKYLKLSGNLQVEIDYEKFKEDGLWDGLKGYLTNSKLHPGKVIENYKNLWQIEKAFRISKTDLMVRPIYHRLKNRIEAHICISFIAYTVYKELERILYQEKAPFSVKRAIALTHTMYALDFTLPESKLSKTININFDIDQKLLCRLLNI